MTVDENRCEERPDEPRELLPLRPQDLQVLLTLAERPLHAYGIAKAVEEDERSGVPLEIGSLYRMLARLLTEGLIAEIDDDDAETSDDGSTHGPPRRTYRITELGRRVARAEVERLREVVEVVRERRLLSEPRGS